MVCQRPKRASSISTNQKKAEEKYAYLLCQRPKRASSISTTLRKKYRLYSSLCQRPKRASSISTVPSGIPHKYWLSSPEFCKYLSEFSDNNCFLEVFCHVHIL